MARPPNVLPWSYSSLSAFETCPKRYELTRLTKQVVEAQTEATLHGNEVHKALELHLNGDKHLPEKYEKYLPLVERVRKQPGKRLVEYKFGVTEDFRSTTFFGKDVWFRGVIDVGVVGQKSAILLDWKTGKPKTDADQLKLFAAAGFAAFPYLNQIKTGYVWLAHNKLDANTFTRDDLPDIWREFTPRVIRMVNALETGKFLPKPSGLCRAWCPVPKSMCEFSGKEG